STPARWVTNLGLRRIARVRRERPEVGFGWCKRWEMVAALAFLLTSSPVRSEPFAAGGWSGNSFNDESTGPFSYCAIAPPHTKGDRLTLVLKRSGDFAVGVESAGWAFSPHHNYDIRLRVDRGRTVSVRASAVDRHGLLASIVRPEPLFEALRRGRALIIEVNG